MAHVDMTPEKLLEYEGISVKPDDFDTFWDDGIKKVKEKDAAVNFEKAEFSTPGAECFDMYYTSVDGARIYAKHLRPENISGKIPAIIFFHGAGDDSGAWSDKLKYVSAGYAVFAMDVRGQAGKSEDIGGVKGNTMAGHVMRGVECSNPEKLFYTNVFLDAALLAEIVFSLDFINAENVCVYGGSQGGALSISCAALQPRIKKAGILYPYLSDFKRVWDLKLSQTAYADLFHYFKTRDPLHEREDEIFNLLGYIDIQNLAKRVKAEVLMATGLLDITCPPSTQFAMYNKLRCKKSVLFYPEYGHESINHAFDKIFMFLTNN